MWCMLAAPLIAGNDLRDMTPETKAILMNKELIAIDQDSLGRQATCYRDNGEYQIWIKPLVNNEKAVCLLNKSDEKKSVLVDFALLSQIRSVRGNRSVSNNLENFNIRDLWEQKDLVLKENSIYVEMAPHSVKVYRFIKK